MLSPMKRLPAPTPGGGARETLGLAIIQVIRERAAEIELGRTIPCPCPVNTYVNPRRRGLEHGVLLRILKPPVARCSNVVLDMIEFR